MTFDLPVLPFTYDALEPVISKEAVKTHFEKHHLGYAAKLNKLMEGSATAKVSLENLIKTSSGSILNNAAQIWNHNFYWDCLTKLGKTSISMNLHAALSEEFGSFETFRERFTSAASELFGSGWVWLVADDTGKLQIESMPNGNCPLVYGKRPLLVVDVWEHSYYLDYQSERLSYLKSWWTIVNWDFVGKQFSKIN